MDEIHDHVTVLVDRTLSFSEREIIVRNILSCQYEETDSNSCPPHVNLDCLPADEIDLQWKCYLRSNVPLSNWIALWHHSPHSDESSIYDLNISISKTQSRPILRTDSKRETSTGTNRCNLGVETSIVDVCHVDFEKFEAKIQILDESESDTSIDANDYNIEDDLKTVPLFNLHPVLNDFEDESFLDVVVQETISKTLDHFRFFYKYLWFPWDKDDDDSINWVGEKLALRFQLLQQAESKEFDYCPTWTKLRELKKRYTDLENEKSQMKELEEERWTEETLEIGHLITIENEQASIRKEASILENPVLRLSHEAYSASQVRSAHHTGHTSFIVIRPNTQLSQVQSYMNQVQTFLNGSQSSEVSRHGEMNDDFNTCVVESLQVAIDRCLSRDTIFIPSGHHHISHFGQLILKFSASCGTDEATNNPLVSGLVKLVDRTEEDDEAFIFSTVKYNYAELHEKLNVRCQSDGLDLTGCICLK